MPCPDPRPLSLSRRDVLRAGGFALAGAALPAFAARAGTDGLDAVVAPDAVLDTVYEGGRWCEGAAWDRRAGALVFSDVKKNRLLRLGAGGRAEPFREPSNNANGNAFDAAGRLITCEQLTRRVVRQEADGRLTVLADRFEGRRLNSPNDAAVARDGAVWFTDPLFGIVRPEEGLRAAPEQVGRFVFRLDPGGRLDKVADGFDQPNGIVFSPDQRTLYVSETGAGLHPEGRREIHAFDVRNGRLARERVFAALRADEGLPDGLAVDADGRVYAGTARGAKVWDAAGARLGVIATPATCASLAFGGPDGRRLFLCASDRVHAISLRARGWQ